MIMPTNAEMAKTIISFANDSGDEYYLGIQDNPWKGIGIDGD